MLGTQSNTMSMTPMPLPMTDQDSVLTIDTRFGKITLDKSNPIRFPRGLLGMPDRFHFTLMDAKSSRHPQLGYIVCSYMKCHSGTNPRLP